MGLLAELKTIDSEIENLESQIAELSAYRAELAKKIEYLGIECEDGLVVRKRTRRGIITARFADQYPSVFAEIWKVDWARFGKLFGEDKARDLARQMGVVQQVARVSIADAEKALGKDKIYGSCVETKIIGMEVIADE